MTIIGANLQNFDDICDQKNGLCLVEIVGKAQYEQLAGFPTCLSHEELGIFQFQTWKQNSDILSFPHNSS